MKSTSVISVLAVAGAASAAVVDIAVGMSTGAADIFQFSPANVTASEGDVVRFTFSGSPGNHSVTQSAFTAPCDPLAGGFDSGNIFIPSGLTDGFPQWNLTITNTSAPIWFFCKQLAPSPHCNAGMVGSINAATSGAKTFEAFQAAAMNHTGDSGQSVGALIGSGASASAEAGPLTASGVSAFGTPNPTATAAAGSGTGSGTAASGTGSAPATSSSAAAAGLKAGSFVVALSALFGIVLA